MVRHETKLSLILYYERLFKLKRFFEFDKRILADYAFKPNINKPHGL